MSARITGIESLSAKLMRLAPTVAEAVAKANGQNADEFMSRVAAIIPRERGALAGTLAKAAATRGPLGVMVSIGGPTAPYPAHLEFGHMTKAGVHVPAEPFWFTTLRVTRKRFRARAARAGRAALKKLSVAGA